MFFQRVVSKRTAKQYRKRESAGLRTKKKGAKRHRQVAFVFPTRSEQAYCEAVQEARKRGLANKEERSQATPQVAFVFGLLNFFENAEIVHLW